MKQLLEKSEKQESLPMPFFGMGGRLVLTIYWWIYKTFFFCGKKDFEETIEQLNTPWKVQAWLYANIKYTSDKNPLDEWQPAERTFSRRKGDCEDWAIFANECLRCRYSGLFICMYHGYSGHASYLILDKEAGYKSTSVGTFGLMFHKGKCARDFIGDWNGYEDADKISLRYEDLSTKSDDYIYNL